MASTLVLNYVATRGICFNTNVTMETSTIPSHYTLMAAPGIHAISMEDMNASILIGSQEMLAMKFVVMDITMECKGNGTT